MRLFRVDNVSSVAGMLMVTAAALLFGIVAAIVQVTALPTLLMLQCRSLIEWTLGVATAMLEVHRTQGAAHSEGKATSSRAMELLVGPPHLRGWLVLRALLYWAFFACWWLALSSMPLGDATAIVYCGPVFTATFAYLFLGEQIDWTFYPIVVLDAIGLVLITRPIFLFSASGSSQHSGGGRYMLGAASALASAVVAGLLPVCTRISKDCCWTAVNHVSSALSALVFTPLAILVWVSMDPLAHAQMATGLDELASVGDLRSDGAGKVACLLGATLTGFAGLALQTLGYQREEVRSLLVPHDRAPGHVPKHCQPYPRACCTRPPYQLIRHHLNICALGG